jgi:outer membrane protein TolC
LFSRGRWPDLLLGAFTCAALVGCAAVPVGGNPSRTAKTASSMRVSRAVSAPEPVQLAADFETSDALPEPELPPTPEMLKHQSSEEISPPESVSSRQRTKRARRQPTDGLPAVPLLPAPAAPAEPSDSAAEDGATKPIDLPTALRLADARNPLVGFTREQIRQAYARLEQANVLWLPSIRGGVGFNRHEGAIQDTPGMQMLSSRGAFYTGLGAGAFGAGSPLVPGVWANFKLADAIFQPLAAQQALGARRAAMGATLNDTLLKVALAYLELLRAAQEVAIAEETQENAGSLSDLTKDYAQAGQGLWSDADQAAAELALRRNNVLRAQESVGVASARLAELLRLDPCLRLDPIEPVVTPLDVTPHDQCASDLIAAGLNQRPELAEAKYLIAEAVAKYKREKYAPFVPSLILGVSDGEMSAGPSTNYAAGQNRFDMDAMAYWELRNFGLGEQAARRDASSQVQQSRWRQIQLMDQVAREITEAHVQVLARQKQIDVAERGVQAAAHSYELNIERIKEAKGLPIEALQSIQALDQARREYLRSVIDYNSAQFSLLWALGWPDLHGG